MPKSSQKPAGSEQTASQRGKSRFGSSGRSARVVLPERPPRAVDHEIVSILLGADPASLTEKSQDSGNAVPPEPGDAAQPSDPAAEAAPITISSDSTLQPTSVATPPKAVQSGGPDLAGNVSTSERVLEEPVSLRVEGVTADEEGIQAAEISAPARRHTPAATEHHAEIGARPPTRGMSAQDNPITSFEEFADRWRHGLRKGQLKICEVIYQKTYAVGQTECVTSFSELGRLSGLKMRQCFNVIAQLEALKFVERARSEGTSNKKDQGSVIRFYLFPFQ
ncbi:MAG TPA: hypothetical protein VF064_14250 [Pyrinomonadaceae bacterium]